MSTPEDARETVSESCETLTLIHGPQIFVKYLKKILTGSHRRLHILTKNLDPILFSDDEVCSLISQLARRHPQVEIRIMVKETQALNTQHHKLVTLYQRLPSKIEMRKLLVQPDNENQEYVIVDGRQVLLQHEASHYDGFCNTDDAPQAKSLLEEFNQLWLSQTAEIKELRPLSL